MSRAGRPESLHAIKPAEDRCRERMGVSHEPGSVLDHRIFRWGRPYNDGVRLRRRSVIADGNRESFQIRGAIEKLTRR
jgi:hypothetical protein